MLGFFTGGGTNFDKILLTVQPKKGTAILWYNIFPNSQKIDIRTTHEAMPVVSEIFPIMLLTLLRIRRIIMSFTMTAVLPLH